MARKLVFHERLLLKLDGFGIEVRLGLVKTLISDVVVARGVLHHAIHRGVAAQLFQGLIVAPLLFLLLLELFLLLLPPPLRVAVLGGLIALDLAHQAG